MKESFNPRDANTGELPYAIAEHFRCNVPVYYCYGSAGVSSGRLPTKKTSRDKARLGDPR